jgi:putative transposase
MIKSSRHKIDASNKGKLERYELFLEDYSNFTKSVVEYIWRYGYGGFSVKHKKLDLPKYINYKDFGFIKSDLSARARSSAVDQASEIIRSSIEKQRRIIWVQENKNPLAKDKKFSKPNLSVVKPRLSSKCCDWKLCESGEFFGFLRVKSVGRKYGSFNIPVRFSKKVEGKMLAGFLLSKRGVQISWEVETSPLSGGKDKVLAIDQGLISVATCSDGQILKSRDTHGHSMSSILDKLSRKKKGSGAFLRAQDHRKNFVNWSINQINFNGVKEVRLEKVVNIRFKKKSSRKMSHWSNPEIRDKIKRRCEELEVPVVEQSCCFKSQRCSSCGQVRKANRKSKVYSCKNCGYCGDADYNAALNHLVDLPDVPKAFLGQKYNLGNGFFWKPSGFYNFDGSELRVPNS